MDNDFVYKRSTTGGGYEKSYIRVDKTKDQLFEDAKKVAHSLDEYDSLKDTKIDNAFTFGYYMAILVAKACVKHEGLTVGRAKEVLFDDYLIKNVFLPSRVTIEEIWEKSYAKFVGKMLNHYLNVYYVGVIEKGEHNVRMWTGESTGVSGDCRDFYAETHRRRLEKIVQNVDSIGMGDLLTFENAHLLGESLDNLVFKDSKKGAGVNLSYNVALSYDVVDDSFKVEDEEDGDESGVEDEGESAVSEVEPEPGNTDIFDTEPHNRPKLSEDVENETDEGLDAIKNEWDRTKELEEYAFLHKWRNLFDLSRKDGFDSKSRNRLFSIMGIMLDMAIEEKRYPRIEAKIKDKKLDIKFDYEEEKPKDEKVVGFIKPKKKKGDKESEA